MIEYVVSESPDHRILAKASKALCEGGLICFPTDTNWVVACDPNSKAGVEALYKIRKADPDKHFSLLCDNISTASELAFISDTAFRLIRSRVPGSYTFIFEAKKKITKALKASKRDKEIGLRIPPSKLVQELIRFHGESLVSANVNHEMLGLADETIEIYGFLIDDSIGHQLAMVLDPGEYEFLGSSSIVSFVGGSLVVIREGAGDIGPFA